MLSVVRDAGADKDKYDMVSALETTSRRGERTNTSGPCGRNHGTVEVGGRHSLREPEKDFPGSITTELSLEGQAVVHPGGEDEPFVDEGTVYTKAPRCDRRQYIEATVSSLWPPYQEAFPKGR